MAIQLGNEMFDNVQCNYEVGICRFPMLSTIMSKNSAYLYTYQSLLTNRARDVMWKNVVVDQTDALSQADLVTEKSVDRRDKLKKSSC